MLALKEFNVTVEEKVLKFKAKEFFIVDDTFTMIPERTKKFCDLLSELETFFIWGCESRADIVDKDLL